MLFELKNISASTEEKDIVHDVSLALGEGEIAVLMGPNGSGKSSLVNSVMGHPNFTCSNGTMLLNVTDVTKCSTDKKAQAGLFLSLQHIPKVGGINLATFLHKIHASSATQPNDVLEFYLECKEVAAEFGIPEKLLDRPLTQGLSGGEKKLSEALQLAVLKPKLAILDEIDSGVDVDALKTVFKVIEKLKGEGTGFLIISHHPSLLSHISPDKVFVMAGGKLMKSGGKELASAVLRDGFCNVLECPLEEHCKAKD
jgi:Fe-S cluster assembly ATP-binding protein